MNGLWNKEKDKGGVNAAPLQHTTLIVNLTYDILPSVSLLSSKGLCLLLSLNKCGKRFPLRNLDSPLKPQPKLAIINDNNC